MNSTRLFTSPTSEYDDTPHPTNKVLIITDTNGLVAYVAEGSIEWLKDFASENFPLETKDISWSAQ